MKNLIFIFLLIPFYIFSSIDLQPYEKKIFSQNGEDGITIKLLELIGYTNKYFVEFGTADGFECNTKVLWQNFGFKGLLMDGSNANDTINLKQEFITAENINNLFYKYNVPKEFDVLSIDIDFNDFYVWNALKNYSPRIVIIEYNAVHLPHEDKVVVYDSTHMWDLCDYFGASILAYRKLGNLKGYTLVYADNNGVNLFFVRSDILKRKRLVFKDQDDEIALYKPARYTFPGKGSYGHLEDPQKRPWISSDEALK